MVGLLFYQLGGKDCIHGLAGTGTDALRPLPEAVTVPLKILLMRRRHMLCDCAILTFATIQSTVRRDSIVVVENLNGLVCDSHINFALYIFMWNGV